MTEKEKAARQALRDHVKEQRALAKQQIARVQAAKKAGVPLEDTAEILGISLRTAYNRLEGKGPRAGAKWRE